MKKFILPIFLATLISCTGVFANVNQNTLSIIKNEQENIIHKDNTEINNFNVILDDQNISLENGALLYKDTVYLPIRELSEYLGFSVSYDKDNKVSILSNDEIVVEIPQNRKKLL